ncbi:hypothetical protein CASFOL_003484 [Castilleja foliolosa]|uniref:Heat stress transcription factor n=1 Tax=Castilleja foliolosa TaxID=1961234 RepID=A0ABD3EHA6_9LAMI
MEAGGGGTVVAASLPPFLSKTYDMVDDPSTDAVVSWGQNNNSFVVWNVPDFSRDLLPKYFKHSNFSSFVRQLNTYGFRKVDSDNWAFANEGFLRGHKHLLKNIIRRKPSQAQPQPQQQQQQPIQVPIPSSTGSCIEVGKLGIVEEVERLKSDKNILMQELVRLRQQQQSTDNQLQTVGQRVHGMEQRQQQMMSFLAKAMQSPGFVSQIVHNNDASSRQISGGNKKRRLPNQEEESLAHKYSITSPDGQIVKYQPLMNEAAKSMLRQILKINTREPKLSNPNGFLIDNVADSSSSTIMSGVTLAEVLPNMGGALTEIQSHNNGLPDFIPPQVVIPGKPTTVGPDDELRCGDTTISGFVDEPKTVGSDELLADNDVDILLDDNHKLPGINDVFWEQFLSGSPLTGDTDDVNSGKDQAEQELEWDKLKNMHNVTEQMGLLASTYDS